MSNVINRSTCTCRPGLGRATHGMSALAWVGRWVSFDVRHRRHVRSGSKMRPLSRLLVPAFALVLATVSVAVIAQPGVAQARGGSGVLSKNGRVGKVYVGNATVAKVRRWAGHPSSTSRETGEGGVAIYVMRYDCGHGRSSSYYFGRHRRLANFATTCHRWRTADGTRVGDAYDEAVANEHKASQPSCGDGESITRVGRAYLFVTFFTTGGNVRALAVAGHNSVLGC